MEVLTQKSCGDTDSDGHAKFQLYLYIATDIPLQNLWYHIWLSSFRGEDLNVICYQNMPNLHNRYISAERKISQKHPEYMLNYSLPCSCS